MIQKPPSSTPFVKPNGNLAQGWAQWVDSVSRKADASLASDGSHNDLSNRDANDCHPIGAIINLTDTIAAFTIKDAELETIANDALSTATNADTNATSAINQVGALTTGLENVSNQVTAIDNRVTILENEPAIDLSNVQQIGFNISPFTTITSEGQLQWNSTDHTLDIGLANGSVLQAGQEELTYVYNNSGALIANGSPVYISGSQGQRVTIAIADSASATGDDTIAITTADIADGAYGYVTRAGLVRGIDTNSWDEGNTLWLVGTVLNNSPAPKPQHQVIVGTVVKKGGIGAGDIMVNIRTICSLTELSDVNMTGATEGSVAMLGSSSIYTNYNFKENWSATKEISGFENNNTITVTYSGRTITLSSATQIYYWWQGVRKTLGTTTWTSSAHSATVGTYYLYSTDGVNFTWGTSLWNFYDIQVASVIYASATKYIALREVHGLGDWNYHRTAHWGIGTIRNGSTPTGGTIGGYVIGNTGTAERRPSATVVDLLDEDLVSTVGALADGGPYSHLQLASATTTDYVLNTMVEIVHMNGTTVQYQNPATAAWVDMNPNRYANVYLIALPATADTIGQYGRWLWFQPQAQFNTLALAQADSFVNVNKANLINLFAEFLPVAKVTIQSNATNFSIAAVEQLYGSRASASGVPAPVATTASAVSFVPVGNIASTDVQSAIAELDTEKSPAFALTAGKIPKIGVGGAILADSNLSDSGTAITASVPIIVNSSGEGLKLVGGVNGPSYMRFNGGAAGTATAYVGLGSSGNRTLSLVNSYTGATVEIGVNDSSQLFLKPTEFECIVDLLTGGYRFKNGFFTGYAGLWGQNTTPSATNYTFLSKLDGTDTNLNTTNSWAIAINNVPQLYGSSTGITNTNNFILDKEQRYTFPTATNGTIDVTGKTVVFINSTSTIAGGTKGQIIYLVNESTTNDYVVTWPWKSGSNQTSTIGIVKGETLICYANGYFKLVS